MANRGVLLALLMTAVLFEASFAVRCYKCDYSRTNSNDTACLSESSSVTRTVQCDSGWCIEHTAGTKGENHLLSAEKNVVESKEACKDCI